jgi:hypothetical protein
MFSGMKETEKEDYPDSPVLKRFLLMHISLSYPAKSGHTTKAA